MNVGIVMYSDADAYFEASPEKQARMRAWYGMHLSQEPFNNNKHRNNKKLL